jgi:hypothetical protein
MPTRFPVTARATFTKTSGVAPGGSINLTVDEAKFLLAAKECVAPTAAANTVAPVRSGTAQVGQTLSCTQGTWTGSNIVYTYEWQVNKGAYWERHTTASGASTFVIPADCLGFTLRCVVRATNGAGTVSVATTASVAVVAA